MKRFCHHLCSSAELHSSTKIVTSVEDTLITLKMNNVTKTYIFSKALLYLWPYKSLISMLQCMQSVGKPGKGGNQQADAESW